MKYILKRKTVKYDLFEKQVEELDSSEFDDEKAAFDAMVKEHDYLYDFAKKTDILVSGKIILNNDQTSAIIYYKDYSYDLMEIVSK